MNLKEGKARVENTVLDIPHTVWGLILENFDRQELARFMRTCRMFRGIAKKVPVYAHSNELIRKILELKAEVSGAKWPFYGRGLSSIRSLSWDQQNNVLPYLSVANDLCHLIHLFKQCFKIPAGSKSFVMAAEELSDYWLKNYGIFQRRAQFIEFVDNKFKEIERLLREEKKSRKISLFHRVRPQGMEELHELMQQLVAKSPVTYQQEPSPTHMSDNPFDYRLAGPL